MYAADHYFEAQQNPVSYTETNMNYRSRINWLVVTFIVHRDEHIHDIIEAGFRLVKPSTFITSRFLSANRPDYIAQQPRCMRERLRMTATPEWASLTNPFALPLRCWFKDAAAVDSHHICSVTRDGKGKWWGRLHCYWYMHTLPLIHFRIIICEHHIGHFSGQFLNVGRGI